MLDFLQDLRIDQLSFWLGFLVGILFLWIASRLLPLARQARQDRQQGRQQTKTGAVSLAEARYRYDMLQHAQRLHLAAVLFPLDEIRVEPRIQALPPRVIPGEPNPWEDISSLVIPYLPDCPEFPATFSGKTLSLSLALSRGAILVLMGTPGSGKTTALAHLACQMARREASAGKAGNLLPILVHCEDVLPDGQFGGDVPGAILKALAGQLSKSDPQQAAELLRDALDKGQAVLLLDGLDSARPEQYAAGLQFLSAFREQYANVQAVVAASPENIAGLTSLGFIPVAMAGWDPQTRLRFIRQWGKRWRRYISGSAPPDKSPIDQDLLDAWLSPAGQAITPLEITLKVWSAYASDALGSGPVEAIEAYLRRIFAGRPDLRQPVEDFAFQALALPDSDGGPHHRPFIPDTALMESGLIVRRGDSRYAINHPMIAAFLAAASLARSGSSGDLADWPEWPGKGLLLEMLSARVDLAQQVRPALDNRSDALFDSTFRVARWLRLSRREASWRPAVMRALATLAQQERQPMALRSRALAALINSGDPGVAKLLNQMLASGSESQQVLAALGLGYDHNGQAVPALSNLIEEASPVAGRAACLALAAIGDTAAIESLAWALVHGGDAARGAAAEALARHPEAGYALLEEGSQMENLLVRRACIAGLAQIRQPWAIQRIESMSVEDKEWVVRAAAAQALELLNGPEHNLPEPLPGLAETPWLIAFGGELGLGVSPGKPAEDLLRRALQEGNEEQQLAAIEYLGQHGQAGDIPRLLRIQEERGGALREAAYHTLWQLSAAGIKSFQRIS